MRVRHYQITNAFKWLNTDVFDSLINEKNIVFEIDILDTEWGYCVDDEIPGKTLIVITNEVQDTQFLLDLLCNEMIHAWQIQTFYGRAGYGLDYEIMAQAANRDGIHP